MLTLYYSSKTKEVAVWQDRLQRMTIKHRLIRKEELAEPQLLDGEDDIQGVASINIHLDKLEDFVKSWYEDRCDKYEF
jgi:phage host-nuclease inhibitor protein Gam